MGNLAIVVDDSILVRHTLCRFLEERGYTVEAAGDGLEALEMLERLRPDVIITDLEMPRMTGSEFIAALRAAPATAAIPVVVLAGKGSCSRAQVAAHCTVYKDIEMVSQLGRALDSLDAPLPRA
jgi:CheY-like chemotaxis protein